MKSCRRRNSTEQFTEEDGLKIWEGQHTLKVWEQIRTEHWANDLILVPDLVFVAKAISHS